MADVITLAENAAAKAMCRTNCPYRDCACPKLWRGYIAAAGNALDAIGFRELVEALMPFAEYGKQRGDGVNVTLAATGTYDSGAAITADDTRRAAAVIAKLEAGNE